MGGLGRRGRAGVTSQLWRDAGGTSPLGSNDLEFRLAAPDGDAPSISQRLDAPRFGWPPAFDGKLRSIKRCDLMCDAVHESLGSVFWSISRNIAWLLRTSNSQPKLRLLGNYLRLSVKYLLLVRLLGREITVEKVLGYTVRFFDYPALLLVFGEVFIQENYYFRPESDEPHIIDCGCNIGMTILYFKTLYPRATVTGFEANPVTFEALKRNLEDNGLTDVQVFNKAVYNREGQLGFYDNPDRPGSVGFSVQKRHGHPMPLAVDAVLLSNYIQGPVDFLKMDVEGSENAVIAELAAHHKLSLIREMIMEYHHHLSPDCDELAALLGTLERDGLGYLIKAFCLFEKKLEQAMLIYAYQKRGAATSSVNSIRSISTGRVEPKASIPVNAGAKPQG